MKAAAIAYGESVLRDDSSDSTHGSGDLRRQAGDDCGSLVSDGSVRSTVYACRLPSDGLAWLETELDHIEHEPYLSKGGAGITFPKMLRHLPQTVGKAPWVELEV